MERLSVQSAGNADDLFYDAKQGFTFVDVDPAYNDPDHGTAVSKTALNIGDTVGLLCASAIGHRSFSPGYAHGLVAAIERRYGDEGLEAVRKALFTLHITPNVSLDYRQKATLDIYAILSGQN